MDVDMYNLTGLIASAGVAVGRAAVFGPLSIPFDDEPARDQNWEIDRLQQAARESVHELQQLQHKVQRSMGVDFAHIFRSQQTIAEDGVILTEVVDAIRNSSLCAESALRRVFHHYAGLFAELGDDDLNKTRATDIDDVYDRILRHLLGVPAVDLSDLPDSAIIVAPDLFPSDTVMLDAERVAGIITERGGPSSHVAILAKNLGIPAAVGVTGVVDRISLNDRVVLDASDGITARVVIEPTEDVLLEVRRNEAGLVRRAGWIERFRGTSPVTRDGTSIVLSANVGSTPELATARAAGARSVGLYRSEFLFLGSQRLPDEEVQYAAYRRAAEVFHDGFVVIRTLDIGGDKQIPSIQLPREENPFLGNRALRLCLARPEIFHTQVRAILRAGANGPIRMMFPMVGGVPELDQALGIVEEVRQELRREGMPHDPDVEIGIMMEVPSAVLVADELARRVDFFSVGTNDLTQYLLAADRLNSSIAAYYRVYDPAVFRAIRHVVDAARRNACWVGVCGELGGDPLAIPVLVGLGVTELSMSPGMLAEATWVIRSMAWEKTERLAEEVLQMESHTMIKDRLVEIYQKKMLRLERESISEAESSVEDDEHAGGHAK